jgi:hypothetical protein
VLQCGLSQREFSILSAAQARASMSFAIEFSSVS